MPLPRLLAMTCAALLAAHVSRTDAAAAGPALEGTSWTLTALPGRSLLTQPAATLRFEAGRAVGSDGCNQYGGSYVAEGTRLQLRSDLISTRRACPQPVDQQARAFTAALRAARAARVEGRTLQLLDATGNPLATLALQDQGLADTTWSVTGYNNGRQAVVSVLRGTTLTIEFLGNGRLGGTAGCNRYIGGFTQQQQSVNIIRPAPTRRVCAEPAGIMAQEAAFLAALQSAKRLRVDGDRLELRTADDRIALTATRVAGPPPLAATPAAASAGADAQGAPAGRTQARTVAGDLVYVADAATLTECASGRRHPVAMEGDWPRMERAYRAGAQRPGAPLHVTFDGAVAPRPQAEGHGTEASFTVRRFIHAWPGETCERARADARFVNTYWRVVALGGTDVQAVEGRNEPRVLIRAARDDAARGEYRATAGCNTIDGEWTLVDRTLRFAPGRTTQMACPSPLAELERQLIDALARTARRQLKANTLELFDASGGSLALFQATYL